LIPVHQLFVLEKDRNRNSKNENTYSHIFQAIDDHTMEGRLNVMNEEMLESKSSHVNTESQAGSMSSFPNSSFQVNNSPVLEHYSRKHHQTTHPSDNALNCHVPQKQRIHRPLSTYTSLGSPIRPLGSHRLRSVSLGNAPACLQSRSVPSSPSPQQRPTYNPVYFGAGIPSSSALLLPLPPPFHSAADGSQNLTPSDTADIIPPELSDERKAMEAACAAERHRAQLLEQEEKNMTADELRAVLKKERLRTAKIQSDFAALRYGTVQQQFQAEVLEEGRINGLMRRMDLLQEEKGRIILELEREEEMVRMLVFLALFLIMH
jgi:hypothetical protein